MLRTLQNAWERVRSTSLMPAARSREESTAAQPADGGTDGLVAVRDGTIQITDPSGGGLLPVLVPGEDVRLSVDGEEVDRPVAVWAGKHITVVPRAPASCPVRDFRIRVTPEAMAAFLELAPPGPPGHRVADREPAHVVHLAAEPLPGLQVNPSPQEIASALAQAGVVHGVDADAILAALAATETAPVQVAAGTPPVPTQQARVQTVLRVPAEEDAEGLACRVRPGEQVARLHPPRAGVAGRNVLGAEIPPEPIRPLTMVAGPGVQLLGEGARAIAVAPGRPRLVEREPGTMEVSVVPVTEISQPLLARPEPYRFLGDVVVRGPVGEGVALHATGWIWVMGSVTGAVLEAGQGIQLDDGANRSHLRTGGLRSGLKLLGRLYAQLLEEVQLLQQAAVQVLAHPRYANLPGESALGPVIRLLAENRFAHLRNWLGQSRKTLQALAGLQPPIDLEAVLNTVEHHLYGGGVRKVEDLEQLLDAVRAAQRWLAEATAESRVPAPIRAPSLLRCEVQADGAVRVEGQGAELSMVTASGPVRISTLRNCCLQSEVGIEVSLAISPESYEATLEVPTGGHIHADVIVGRVRLEVGKWRHTFRTRATRVRVETGPDGVVAATAAGKPIPA